MTLTHNSIKTNYQLRLALKGEEIKKRQKINFYCNNLIGRIVIELMSELGFRYIEPTLYKRPTGEVMILTQLPTDYLPEYEIVLKIEDKFYTDQKEIFDQLSILAINEKIKIDVFGIKRKR